MVHAEAEPTAYRTTAIVGLALLSGSFLAFSVVFLLLLLPGVGSINIFATLIAYPSVTLVMFIITLVGLLGDVSSRARDREDYLSPYRAMLGMPRHVWRIATFLAGVPLIWAASVVTGSLFFQYTTGTTIPQVDFNSPGMNVNFTTVNGLFNVNYFVTFVLLLGFSLLLFAASSYTFLVYSLTPFMPVRSGEIAKWMSYERLTFVKPAEKTK